MNPTRVAGGVARPRLAALILAGSALVLVATPSLLWLTGSRPDVGSLPIAATDHEAGAPVRSGPGAEPEATGQVANPVANPVVRSARLEDYRPAPHGPRPVGVTIEAIGVRARVVPVGVEEGTTNIVVPPTVHTIGWFRFGPSPGANGSAVLIGHVDSRAQGPGAFFRLRELEPGDVVSVGFADGTRSTFRVVARRSFPKSGLPTEVFQRSGRPVLTLVTCGGTFDPTTRSYADNVVVFAVPID
ncbi:MAG: class F sortase [Candidatus Rokuibacteriota bacterium]